MTDASTGYFGRPLPSEGRIRDIPSNLVGSIPSAVRRRGRRFAETLRIRRTMRLDEALRRLTRYFRAFTPGEPPATTGDIYLDLARGQKGICRHRSFGFVVTALALGIPARYVVNEAHVFVEVWLPGLDSGWMRIDLGGSADELVVHNAHDKARHLQHAFDPFDRPEPFAQQVTRGELAGARTVSGLPPARRPGPSSDRTPGENAVDAHVEEALKLGLAAPVAAAGDKATQTTLEISKSILYRGERVRLQGRVMSASGAPLRAGLVQLLLLDSATGEPVALLGLAQLNPSDGTFGSNIALSKQQPPGDYELAAQFIGGGGYAPSTSP